MALRKHAKYIEYSYFTMKNWRFSDKNSDIFHISAQNMIMDTRYSLNTINIFTSCIDTFKFSLLRTHENTDVSITLDENIYGIHSKRVNILCLYSDPSLQRKPFVPKDVAIKMNLLVKHP